MKEQIKTICYGQTKTWNTRKEAMDYFFDAICGSDGSERERYTNIYLKLVMGKAVCSDER